MVTHGRGPNFKNEAEFWRAQYREAADQLRLVYGAAGLLALIAMASWWR